MSELEVEVVAPERTERFRKANEREALSTQWSFRVIWHAQVHEIAAMRDGEILGVLGLRIAASLAHVDALIVAPDARRSGIGRALLARAEDLGKYYNAHKVTLEAPAGSDAEKFFEACGYKIEAVLPQHTWKLDVAIMRKFLL